MIEVQRKEDGRWVLVRRFFDGRDEAAEGFLVALETSNPGIAYQMRAT